MPFVKIDFDSQNASSRQFGVNGTQNQSREFGQHRMVTDHHDTRYRIVDFRQHVEQNFGVGVIV